MSSDQLGNRGKALEDAFFVRQNEELRRRLAETPEARERKQAIAAITGISDAAVIESLSRLDMSTKMLAAIALVPLVLVAWVDGEVDAKERAAIMQAAAEVGLKQGGVGYDILDEMLGRKPEASLQAAWEGYVAAVTDGMDHAERRALMQPLVERARRVAMASGGFLGLGPRVSDAEEKVLAGLTKAFNV
jgi:hypothetical protein